MVVAKRFRLAFAAAKDEGRALDERAERGVWAFGDRFDLRRRFGYGASRMLFAAGAIRFCLTARQMAVVGGCNGG